MNTALLATARRFLARGWLPTPLLGKVPTLKGWTTAPAPSDGDLHGWVYAERNLGVRTGNGLVIADVDPGAIPELLAKLLAIHTPTVRTGRGGYHFYFKGTAKCSVGKVSEHVDVRGDGGQAVMPGSIHPDTGLPYEWIITDEEAELAPYPPWLELMAQEAEKTRKAAAGSRNDTLNRSAFKVAKGGGFPRELADAAVDAGLENREIEATIVSAERAGSKLAPMRHDDEIMVPGEHFVNGGESITVDQTEFARACWKRLPNGMFYNRFGVPGEIADATFDASTVARFRFLASEHLNLCAYIKYGKNYEREHRKLDADLAGLVLAAGREYTPSLRAIVKYPLAGGPHPGWISLFDGEIDFSVTDHRAFWEVLLCDFPFASVADRNGFVAFLLTMIMRPLIDGPVPLFYVGASQPRTGKTKLIGEVAAEIVYGRYIANIALGDDDVEIDKRLSARAFGGHTLFSFDNVHGRINSSVLAAFVTSRMYGGRILGQTKMVEFQNDAVTVLTGNNISMSEELAKRTWRIMLQSPEEHPEARTEFVHDPLIPYLRSMRSKALGSLLTIARGIGKGVTLGGCEEWGRIVGGAMTAVGMPLSQAGFSQWVEQADDAGADMVSLVKAWVEAGAGEREMRDILNWVKGLEVFPKVLECDSERKALTRLGYLLQDASGRVIAGHQLRASGAGSRRQWALVKV